MSSKAQDNVMEILDSAANAFSDAMKAGAKAQEDMVNWWSNFLDGGNPLGDLSKRSRQLFDEAVPEVKKQTQEWMKLLEQNYRRSAELLKKAFDSDQAAAGEDLREKLAELWEQSIDIVKENAATMAQASVGLVEAWTELLGKNLQRCESALKTAPAPKPAAK